MALDSGTIPASRSDHALALGTFLGAGAATMTEVKLGAGEWLAALPALNQAAQAHSSEDQYLLLREWALLMPLEPAPAPNRHDLQRTLDLLRSTAQDLESEAGWYGARHHGLCLGPVAEAEIGAPAGLPADLAWFMEHIATSGAGPGYGLAIHEFEPGWWHLADAGCGADWLMNAATGKVYLDSRACDDGVAEVADSFLTWYEAWLDNTLREGGPFAHWENQVDAAIEILAMAAEEHGVERLTENLKECKLHSGEGESLGPCHACELIYARCGVGPEVLTTAPAPFALP